VAIASAEPDGCEFDRFLAEAAKAADKKSALDAYLARQTSFPIVESTGDVHFVYRGKATDVAIVGDMIGDRREDAMQRFADTDLYHYTTRLEPDASVTYGFIVDYEKPVADPRNPRKGAGMFGDVSLLAMPAFRQTQAAAPAAGAPQGRLDTIEFTTHAGDKEKKRTAQVYLPPGYDAQAGARFPTLYIHDGKEALEKGGLKEVLDGIIGTQAAPVIGVFVTPDNPGELWQPDPYVEMLVKELVPKVDSTYRTIPRPSARASVGAGGAANVALACALSHPDVFQRVGSQSAFVLSRADYDAKIPGAEKQPLVIYMGWGTYDWRSSREAWDTARGNRELWALLRERGHRPSGGESPEGAGWSFWRGHAGEMVATLFPAAR